MESQNIIYIVWYKDGTNEIYDTYQPAPAISYVNLFDAEEEIAALKAEIERKDEALDKIHTKIVARSELYTNDADLVRNIKIIAKQALQGEEK
jgi:hypothetical protein